MTEQVSVGCPWCGEDFDTSVDASGGSAEYVEDCQVCCRPIIFRVDIGADGSLESLQVIREE